MKKLKILTIIVICLQLGVIYLMAGNKLLIKKTGIPIRVKIVPVDPRSLFRGDYVILRYPFSNIKLSEIGVKRADLPTQGNIYVVLKKKGDYWEYKRAYLTVPEVGKNEVVLKGVFIGDFLGVRAGDSLNVRYGIESFFVPEGEGRQIESHREKQKLSAEIYVDSQGNALLSKLFVEDEKITFN